MHKITHRGLCLGIPFPPLPLSQLQESPEGFAEFAHYHKLQLLPFLFEPLPQWGLQYLHEKEEHYVQTPLYKTKSTHKDLSNLCFHMYFDRPTLCILAQAFAWLVAHFLQKFLSNAFSVLLPATKSFTRLNATCKSLGLVPPEITLEKEKYKLFWQSTVAEYTVMVIEHTCILYHLKFFWCSPTRRGMRWRTIAIRVIRVFFLFLLRLFLLCCSLAQTSAHKVNWSAVVFRPIFLRKTIQIT